MLYGVTMLQVYNVSSCYDTTTCIIMYFYSVIHVSCTCSFIHYSMLFIHALYICLPVRCSIF